MKGARRGDWRAQEPTRPRKGDRMGEGASARSGKPRTAALARGWPSRERWKVGPDVSTSSGEEKMS